MDGNCTVVGRLWACFAIGGSSGLMYPNYVSSGCTGGSFCFRLHLSRPIPYKLHKLCPRAKEPKRERDHKRWGPMWPGGLTSPLYARGKERERERDIQDCIKSLCKKAPEDGIQSRSSRKADAHFSMFVERDAEKQLITDGGRLSLPGLNEAMTPLPTTMSANRCYCHCHCQFDFCKCYC